ncbi:uncharacterized protein C2845_PM08G03040 [Panicum miliaceum]|uniref:Uncharacterized protein n=1 Tax=Panicum miliaceum TaxID=4540 RepID=A0A3L6R5A9_PANMI|nr:uncharacterized protein C2845_PM08G03040 [Panicum miliaceum]
MDIPNIFRPALNCITSSIASTMSYGFTWVLSFTGSFNDRTSLLHDGELVGPELADEPAPPAQAQEEVAPATVMTVHMCDIEAATPPPPSAGEEPEPAAQDTELKRVAKSVQTVCLFAASASLVLFVNLPSRDHVTSKGMLAGAAAGEHGAGDALPGEAAVAAVQKWGMIVAVASVLVAFTLRMCMMPAVA